MGMKTRAHGFSLIELLLVLGVLAVLLLAAFVVYPQVRARHQANVETQNLLAIKANFLTLFGRGRDPTNLTSLDLGTANQARLFPASMNGGDYSATATVTSAWGAPLEVTSSALNGITTVTFTYTDIPLNVCIPLFSSAAPHFRNIVIQPGPRGTGMPVVTDGLVLVEQAVGACKDVQSGRGRMRFIVSTYDR